MPGILTFWKDLDDDDKLKVRRIAGLAAALLTVFTILSGVSYLFTWQADQSLLSAKSGDAAGQVGNAAGMMGFRWADFLVREGFGLGSSALVILMAAVSLRLLFSRWKRPMAGTVAVTLTGTVLLSAVLSLISEFTGLRNAFGGGLGGECGASLVGEAFGMIGRFLTALLLAVLSGLWLFIVSRRFRRRVVALCTPKQESSKQPEEREDSLRNPTCEYDGVSSQRPQKQKERKRKDRSETGQERPERQKEPEAQKKPETQQKQIEVIRTERPGTEVKTDLSRINVRDELPDYRFPPLELLDEHSEGRYAVSAEELERNNARIRKALADYKIKIDDVKAVVGPTVTLYKVYKSPGQKIADIKNLQEDIGMSLNSTQVRVVPLNDCVGIEVPNDNPSIVPMRAVLNDDEFRRSKAELPVAIGCTIQQKVKVFDLADAPHLLVAGATKQGKSVGLNVIISSLLYAKHPSELKFVFIDPKMVEFSTYSRLLHHYLGVLPCNDEKEEMENAIVKKASQAAKVLKSLCIEMDQRYELLSKALTPNVMRYNEKYRSRHLLPTEGHRFLPYIVTVIDEYADLTMSVGAGGEEKTIARTINTSVIRLAQKGRAAGIHVILATQRPSADVVSPLIRSNFPMRIAFRVSQKEESQIIIGSSGADKLIGRGDMLLYAGLTRERVQCAYIDSEEINSLTSFIESQKGFRKSYNTPLYLPEVDESTEEGSGGMIDMKNLDERFEEAARLIVTNQRGSTSDLQRRLGMGYAKAGRVMDQLEAAGVVGPQEGSKTRQVLISSLDELETVLQAYRNQ